ncbi:hypothetical protein BU25DRAFT_466777 [Macroventuria anomochaeta]|uniref:Uncharacterized protein n=1 Tax=Macroventuria anomochaeta TaxID=301207 RepID=A0ACB6S5F0_9PLEO|nr:uncharacterized protein BU25DRAFT_466777 [Macroventuria anomochaeta]KAF2628855.1 hypothetical protein BU25DRAFT_466777 [Macroventuria anomochaeta]
MVLAARASVGLQQQNTILAHIGKKTLAIIEKLSRHHRRYSAVLWLDGRSEYSLKRSIANCAGRIPQGQIPGVSRAYATDSGADVDAVVKDVMGWLARPDSNSWLLIFDNVDREYGERGGDADAYDVKDYLSGADHGSVLITTRLARLEQLGKSQQLSKVDDEQAQAMLKTWYKKTYDTTEGDHLLQLLDGLPLAIAQAGAYLQESGVGLKTYLRFYEQQWSELLKVDGVREVPLQDYPDRSVWTTWAISYYEIRNKHEQRALKINQSSQHFYNYSLVEAVEETASYTTHPVVHRWAYYYQGKQSARELDQVAVVAVGRAVPDHSGVDWAALQRRLLPHAQACSTYQGKLTEAEKMYQRALQGKEDALSPKHTSTLRTVNNLGILYKNQGKLAEAEKMCQRALEGREDARGPKHTSTLDTFNNLGNLYRTQGKLAEAEKMYQRVLEGREDALGDPPVRRYMPALTTLQNMGDLYVKQKKYAEALEVYSRALPRLQCVLGQSSERCRQLEARMQVLSNLQASKVEFTQPSGVKDVPKSRPEQEKRTWKRQSGQYVKRVFQ